MLSNDLFGDLEGVNLSQLNQIDLFEWIDFTQHDLSRLDQIPLDFLYTSGGPSGFNDDMRLE